MPDEATPGQLMLSQLDSSRPTLSVLSDRPDRMILSLKSEGQRLGQMSLSPVNHLRQGAMEISTSQIRKEFQGSGFGKEIYNQAIEHAKRKGATAIFSDDQVSESAHRVWKSLSREHNVQRVGERYMIDLQVAKKVMATGASQTVAGTGNYVKDIIYGARKIRSLI
jgi:GNAT superfamily N-acetyltransferase